MQENINSIFFVPEAKLSPEEYASSLGELCRNANDSYARMLTAAGDRAASKKGVSAAQRVERKYKARLEALNSMDFSACTEEELSGCYQEVSAIITAIREARDSLTLP